MDLTAVDLAQGRGKGPGDLPPDIEKKLEEWNKKNPQQ